MILNKKYALHTIDNLLDYATHYYMTDRNNQAIQLLNSATLILCCSDDNSNEFKVRLNNIQELAQNIICQETSRFESDLQQKFKCF